MLDTLKKRGPAIFTGLLSLAMAVLIMGFGLFFVRPAEKDGEDQVIVVREGLSLKEVAKRLEVKGIIKDKTLFMLWTRLMGYSRQIKAGEYLLSSGMAPVNIIEILTRGMIITYPVTIPEGFSLDQIGVLLEEKKLVTKKNFNAFVHHPDNVKELGISGPSLEGYLYPDTYHFGRGLTAGSIIDTMIGRFRKMVEPYGKRMAELGMTVKEVVTLASIIEKETGKGDERPLISSVFQNRIRKGMRLESDPTVIYGIDDFDGNLTKKDLLNFTPYNTYVIKGLPPGPIANPGIESIKAVLYPAETDYLYFVSKNDGSHHFSKSLKEHNRAVMLYQKRKRP